MTIPVPWAELAGGRGVAARPKILTGTTGGNRRSPFSLESDVPFPSQRPGKGSNGLRDREGQALPWRGGQGEEP